MVAMVGTTRRGRHSKKYSDHLTGERGDDDNDGDNGGTQHHQSQQQQRRKRRKERFVTVQQRLFLPLLFIIIFFLGSYYWMTQYHSHHPNANNDPNNNNDNNDVLMTLQQFSSFQSQAQRQQQPQPLKTPTNSKRTKLRTSSSSHPQQPYSTTSTTTSTSSWNIVSLNKSLSTTTTILPKGRHEACFIMANNGKGYLIGGRGKFPVDEYDPQLKVWNHKSRLFSSSLKLHNNNNNNIPNTTTTTTTTVPLKVIHHMQCILYDNQIWIVSSWTGSYPNESNTNYILIYDPIKDIWINHDTLLHSGLPMERHRGATAVAVYQNEIYISHGVSGGHNTNATVYNYFDKYNPQTKTWTILPNAPTPRDHAGGGIIHVVPPAVTNNIQQQHHQQQDDHGHDLFCVAGGRLSNEIDIFNSVVLPTDCFNFTSNTWNIYPSIPQGRAGAAYGTTCNNQLLIVAGGEGFGRAWNRVDVFDGYQWISFPNLTQARHGITGLAIDCHRHHHGSISSSGSHSYSSSSSMMKGQEEEDTTTTNEEEYYYSDIYIASGHGSQGGKGKDLTTTEVLSVIHQSI